MEMRHMLGKRGVCILLVKNYADTYLGLEFQRQQQHSGH